MVNDAFDEIRELLTRGFNGEIIDNSVVNDLPLYGVGTWTLLCCDTTKLYPFEIWLRRKKECMDQLDRGIHHDTVGTSGMDGKGRRSLDEVATVTVKQTQTWTGLII